MRFGILFARSTDFTATGLRYRNRAFAVLLLPVPVFLAICVALWREP